MEKNRSSRATRSSPQKRRSRSPDHRRDDHQRSHRKRSQSPRTKLVRLPYGTRSLSKYDLREHRAVFALYLDIQKHIDIDELSSDEVKGRWKSFVGKWNRGDLAEGWYDPATKQKADTSTPTEKTATRPRDEPSGQRKPELAPSDSEDDEYGPSLPAQHPNTSRSGPAIPRLEDIQHRNELAQEDEEARREDVRHARKMERKQQKEHLEELVPRAEPGTRERQLEKKRETASANRSFREARSPGAEEVKEGELMGDDGAEGIKAHIKERQRKKTERELRKEEVMRARAAEREEKFAEHRAKEEKTMDMLRGLAKQRYG